MEEISEIKMNKTNGFVKHVLNFDVETKQELLNVVQYSLISIVPVILLNKIVKRFIPTVDEEKGSLEIGAEVLGQMIVLFFGMYFIHRIVTYFPTYTGVEYKEFNIINLILGFLVIVLSLQTKLGEKVQILAKRGFALVGIEDEDDEMIIEEKELNIKVTHPLGNTGLSNIPRHQNSRADLEQKLNLNDNIRNEMMGGGGGGGVNMSNQGPPPPMETQPQQQVQPQAMRTTNFDSMYQEPMAANESFGNFSAF